MKLRIKGDSVRLRVARSELRRLIETGRIEETVHFGPQQEAQLTYALEQTDVDAITVRYQSGRVTVVLPGAAAQAWAEGEDVGVYGDVPVSGGTLEVAVEKDWACLDKGEAENADTFPNPKQGTKC